MPPDQGPNQNRFFRGDFFIILCACLIVTAAPSPQSFWIDEGTMGNLSRSATFSDLQRTLSHMKGSETLMPLTTTYFWSAEKIGGDTEWALRCANLPWLWLGIGCLALVGRRIGWPWLPLLFAIHPVVWFYADEVRPYAIQLGTASWMALGFVEIIQSEGRTRSGFWNLGLASAATILASFLGIFVVAGVAVMLLVLSISRKWELASKHYAVPILMAILNVAVVVSMLPKLAAGAGGSKAWSVGFANLGFAFYELLGFIGLGPGRELIRSSATIGGVEAASHSLVPSSFKLALLGSLYLGLVYAVARIAMEPAAKSRLRLALIATAVPCLSVACLFAAALDSKFPFWGRHLTPTLPFMLLAIGYAASALREVWSGRNTAILLGAFMGMLFLSSLELRFNVLQGKDDYRTAAAFARNEVAHGKLICWIAAKEPAQFYRLPLSDTWPPVPGTASLVIPPAGAESKPDLIIVSKPDLFDRNGSRNRWTQLPDAKAAFLCPSFVVYQFPVGATVEGH